MSFQLTYADLSKDLFMSGIRKIVNYDGFRDPKLLYNCARIGSLLDIELKTFREVREKFLKKAKDAKPADEANPTPEDLALLKTLQDEADKLNEVTVTIERHKIPLYELGDVGLTANELLALTPMIVFDEERPKLVALS